MIEVKKLTYDTKTKCYVTTGQPLPLSRERLAENYSEIAFGPEGIDLQKVVDGPGPNLIRIYSTGQ